MLGVTGEAVTVAVYTVALLEVAGAQVSALPVLAYDIPQSADGLLGRDFLSRFIVTVDDSAGRVTLRPRR